MNAVLELDYVVMRQSASMDMAHTYVNVKKIMKIALRQSQAPCVFVVHDQVCIFKITALLILGILKL